MNCLAGVSRRDLVLKCLTGIPLAFSPAWMLRASDDLRHGETEFYRVLEDARIAFCWREFSRAFELYQNALKLLPEGADSSLLAEILEEQKSLRKILSEHQERLSNYWAGVRAAPNNAENRYWLAHSLFRLGRTEEAEEQFQMVLNLLDPDWRPGCWLALGWYNYRRRMYWEALECFDRVLEFSGETDALSSYIQKENCANALENIILNYVAMGHRREAEATTRDYVRKFGRLPWADRRMLKRAGFDADAIYIEQCGLAM